MLILKKGFDTFDHKGTISQTVCLLHTAWVQVPLQTISHQHYDLSNFKTNQVERLESELKREREYTSQVMEQVRIQGITIFIFDERSKFFPHRFQSTREKLKYELALANLNAVSMISCMISLDVATSVLIIVINNLRELQCVVVE